MKDKRSWLKQEREKYEKVWKTDEYRKARSFGEIFIDRLPIMDWLKNNSVETVLDAGCGTGRMLRSLKQKDTYLQVAGMDIAENSIDPRLKDIFINGCLWNEEDYPKQYDAIFCVDVLEHIPEDMVRDVLSNFDKFSKKLIFLSASLEKDVFGPRLIGEPLHITVKGAFWWIERFAELDRKLEFLMASTGHIDAVLSK